ncbi:hypothetical protein RHECIAT_CH0003054 [Rhizobium etli CIAT 652]|uniref:Uncharacterized protein n=1 Tax=Rhizobium etli (strain CIAT 652) TaxID=491916 RepID=B3PUC2_RHIE6|nr:hypothetical protein RHECIAT_CH0003054 [Rhizobium etli CIAT 652]KKZ86210.1 hypothetical protein RPHASCH2410_CH18260 [Rhizobium phaseoli Ch24-10]
MSAACSIHLSFLDGIDDDGRGVGGFVRSLRGRFLPIIVLGRHQHEFASAMTGNLDGLMLRLTLKFAEFSLKFQRRGPSHDRFPAFDIRIYV